MQALFKTEIDNIGIEYEIISCKNEQQSLAEVEQRLGINDSKINQLNIDIERLTSHADGWDYAISVASGIIAGIIDSLWVGEFSIDRAKEWGNEEVNEFVIKVAESQGYKSNGKYDNDDLEKAIKYLENKYHLAGDGGKVKNAYGSGLQHHLRDFRHHPTPVGLVFSLLTQFTSKAYGTDKNGVFLIVDIEERDMFLIGKDVPQKIVFGFVYWFFHMVSDMAGTSTNPGAGTGLPGPLVSFLKELSALPFFKKANKDGVKEFSLWISKLFNGTLLSERDSNGKLIPLRFDLRAEIGVVQEIGRQTIPVVINECIVRGFYFIRSFVNEVKEKKIKSISNLNRIEWKKTLPFKNRTIVRMITISTSTFMAFDLADAAIRSAIKSGGNSALFAKNFLLRVNFVGVGRCFVAIGTDVYMATQKTKLRNERITIMSEQLHLMNAKVFYLQSEMWVEAKNAVELTEEVQEIMHKSADFFIESVNVVDDDLESIGEKTAIIEEKNAGITQEMLDAIKWG